MQGFDSAGERARQFDYGLGRLHFDDGLVDRDGVARGDQPVDYLRLGKPFAQVGQDELLAHQASHTQLFNALRMRSGVGR